MTEDHHDPIGGAHPTGQDANLEDEYQIVTPGTTAADAQIPSESQPAPPDPDERVEAVEAGVDADAE